MKIDLTKEEWDMLSRIIPRNIVLHQISGFCIHKNIEILENILKKLGREWKDDDEVDKDSIKYFMTEMSQKEFEERNKGKVKCSYDFNRIKRKNDEHKID